MSAAPSPSPPSLSAGAASAAIHATAAVIGEDAVVLRGRSGAGKSGLALTLIAAAQARGGFARLVGDDRLLLRRAGERIVVSGHPAIAGCVERRFVGVSSVAFEAQAVAGLVVDLAAPGDDPPRLPADDRRWTLLLGVRLPRLHLGSWHADGVEAILDALRVSAGVPAGVAPA